jgi:hypothetical protein
MKKLIFILTMLFSLIASAEKVNNTFWVENQEGLPMINAKNNAYAYASIAGCLDNELRLESYNLPVTSLRSLIEGKIWVDSKKIKIFLGKFHLTGRYSRMVLSVDNAFIDELRAGNTLYVQWPVPNGNLFIEKYSLLNVTKVLDIYTQKCVNEKNDWFKGKKGTTYFKVEEL